jgi:hypothetical protein
MGGKTPPDLLGRAADHPDEDEQTILGLADPHHNEIPHCAWLSRAWPMPKGAARTDDTISAILGRSASRGNFDRLESQHNPSGKWSITYGSTGGPSRALTGQGCLRS